MLGAPKHQVFGGMPDYIQNMNKTQGQPAIKAPSDRGFFGRFANILMGGEYGDEKMGWVERLGRGADGMNAYRDQMKEQELFMLAQQQAEEAEKARRYQLNVDATLAGFKGRDRAAFLANPEKFGEEYAKNYAPQSFTAGNTYSMRGGPMQRAPMPNKVMPNALGQPTTIDQNTGLQVGQPIGPMKPITVADGADLLQGGKVVHSNPKTQSPSNNGITIGPDGTVQIGGPAGLATTRQMASQDAQQMAAARQKADDLQPVLNTMYSARAELLGPDGIEGTRDDLDTGSYAGLIQMGRKLRPGEQGREARYDNFDALSKEFGIEKLSGIGGNDTERELLTAIQTGPNIGAQEKSNIARLNRQIAVMEFIGESRRNFMSRWINDVGSLSRTAREGPYQGLTYDEALSLYQRQEAMGKGLLGSAVSGQSEPGVNVGVTPQQGDLSDEDYREYLMLKQELGE